MQNSIIFDLEACIGCGLCAKICGSMIITMDGKTPTVSRPALCHSCGHCAAICPEGAITSNHTGNDRAFQVSVPAEGLDPVELLLRKKRSVREFKEKPLEQDVVQRLVAYAEKAPSSGNNRQRIYCVVTDRARIKQLEKAVVEAHRSFLYLLHPWLIQAIKGFNLKMSEGLQGIRVDIQHMQTAFEQGLNPIFKEAPCVIFIAAPSGDIQAQDDCIIAQQYMMLYGETQGIGSCINGYAQYVHKAVERFLDLPKGYRMYSAGIFGYSRYAYKKEISYDKQPEILWR
ncbi:MAG: 4Fe-4S dicluster domain-containing protein [Chloroflexi bacterium]|nr:4Fe-4S dicluster domain-containing protein [Chloroflexota bacterium]